MESVIRGAGVHPFGMTVNARGQADVRAITSPNVWQAAGLGEVYLVGNRRSDFSTTESATFYFKNTSEEKHIHLHQIWYSSNDPCSFRLYFNPTGDITSEPDGSEFQSNLMSANQAAADYKVADAAATGVTASSLGYFEWDNENGLSTVLLDGSIILGQNDSIAMSVTADSGTIRASTYVMLDYHEFEGALTGV